jgi:hypothetical protein
LSGSLARLIQRCFVRQAYRLISIGFQITWTLLGSGSNNSQVIFISVPSHAAPELQFPRVGVPTFVLGEVTRQKPAFAATWAARRNDDHVVPHGFRKRSEIPDHDE